MITDPKDDISNLNIHSEIHLECCENCQEWVNDEEMALVEVYTSKSGLVKMNVCDHCANPIQLEIFQSPSTGMYWILYVTGLGKQRKEIDVAASSIPAVLESFRERYAEVMNMDLVNYSWK